MPRSYGATNAAPYAAAPAVGPAGDTYYNTATGLLYTSNGTVWSSVGSGATSEYWRVSTATTSPAATATSTEVLDTVLGNLVVTAQANTWYRIRYVSRIEASAVPTTADIRIRDGGASTPTSSSTLLTGGSDYLAAVTSTGGTQIVIEQDVQLTAGVHTLGVFLVRTVGTGNVTLTIATGQLREFAVFNPTRTGRQGLTGNQGAPGATITDTASLIDMGTDTTLSLWPGRYGTTSIVGGQIQLIANAVNQYSGIKTADLPVAPLVLNQLEAKVTADLVGTAPLFFFGIKDSTDGNRAGFSLSGTSVTPLDQTNYVDNHPQGTAVTLTANTPLYLALAVGLDATRYGENLPVATSLYMYTSTDGRTWTRRYVNTQPTIAAACRIAFDVQNTTGTSTFLISQLNLVSKTVSWPSGGASGNVLTQGAGGPNDVAWQPAPASAPLGYLATAIGPPSITDFIALSTVATLSFPVVSGRHYRIEAYGNGAQQTTAGTSRLQMADDQGGAIQYVAYNSSLAVNAAMIGSTSMLFNPNTTRTATITLQAASSAGAFRIQINGCRMWAEDIGG